MPPTTEKIDKTPLLPDSRDQDHNMADLPKWARTEEAAGGGGELGDKLVDEETGEDKPDAPVPAAEEGSVHSEHQEMDSGLASRALCFFRTLSILTGLLALVVIGTNGYIIYDRFGDLKGEHHYR